MIRRNPRAISMNKTEKEIVAKAREALEAGQKALGPVYAAGLLDALLSMPTEEERKIRAEIAAVFENRPTTEPAKPDRPPRADGKCPECARPKRHKVTCSIGRRAKREEKKA